MKYKLTIHDNETGEVLEFDTNLVVAGLTNESLEKGCTTFSMGGGTAKEIAQLMNGMEELKKRMYREEPRVALLMALKDAVGDTDGRTLDLSEMFRGRHGGGEHD